MLLASKDHECEGQVKVTGRAKRSIGIAAGKMVGVTDGVTSMRTAEDDKGAGKGDCGAGWCLASPEGNSSQGLDLQLLLQDFMHLALLRSLLHLLSPDHIHTPGCQDQVPLDGL